MTMKRIKLLKCSTEKKLMEGLGPSTKLAPWNPERREAKEEVSAEVAEAVEAEEDLAADTEKRNGKDIDQQIKNSPEFIKGLFFICR